MLLQSSNAFTQTGAKLRISKKLEETAGLGKRTGSATGKPMDEALETSETSSLKPQNLKPIPSNLTIPKPRHITGGLGPGGSLRGGGAGRGRAGRDADGFVRPEYGRPSQPPDNRRKLYWACLCKHEQRRSKENQCVRSTTGCLLLLSARPIQPSLASFRKHEQTKSYVNRRRNKNRG